MNFNSKPDHFYDMHLDFAIHHMFIENPKGMDFPHHHDDYEIYFLISGNRKYFVEDKIYTLQPHQVVIFKPNTPHQVTVNLNIPYERSLLYVSPSLFHNAINSCSSLKPFLHTQVFNLSEDHFNRALSYLEKMNEESLKNDAFSYDMIKFTLAELLLFISRHHNSSPIKSNGIDLRIQTAVDFILENHANPITLADAAEIASMSACHFSKSFHKTTGFSFRDFLIKARVEKARDLLESTNLRVSDIAQSVGFSTESLLAQGFRKFMGTTPCQYRKLHRNQSSNHMNIPAENQN